MVEVAKRSADSYEPTGKIVAGGETPLVAIWSLKLALGIAFREGSARASQSNLFAPVAQE